MKTPRFFMGLLIAAGLADSAQAAPAHRLVAIGGAVTEILYELGAGGSVVGVDTTSLYPPSVLKEKPNVGYMRALSAEGVLSLGPSLVLAIEGAGPADTLKQIEAARVPLVTIPDLQTPAGVAAKTLAIGRLVGKEPEAQRLATRITSRFASLAVWRAKIGKPKRVLFVLSLQNGRALVAGRHTAADSMLALAGAVNAAGAMDGYKPMTDEAVIAAAPDAVLMIDTGNHAPAPDIFALPAFSATPAAAARALIVMDGLLLLGFGPRSPDAARDLMATLYPGLAVPALPPLETTP